MVQRPVTGREPQIEVEVLEAWGSTPREAGACMRVGANESHGTIGGGRLEWLAIGHAHKLLENAIGEMGEPEPHAACPPTIAESEATLDLPLGPTTQQCCGGFVRLGFRWAQQDQDRNRDAPVVYLHGMGHVGQAAQRALAPLPFTVMGVDQRLNYPSDLGNHLEAVSQAPEGTWHIIMTHDHALDLQICAALLNKPLVGHIGLIGSRTKRARFFKQLRLQGLDPSPIVCPIGLAGIRGKEPEIIAASLAAELLALRSALMLGSQATAQQA